MQKEKIKLNNEIILDDYAVKIIEDFLTTFDMASEEIKEAISNFVSKRDLESQDLLIKQLASLIKEDELHFFDNVMWENIKRDSTEIIYEINYSNFLKTIFSLAD